MPHPLTPHLRRFLPRESVIDHPSALRAYECDALSAYRQPPLLVVLPETIPQVQRIMRLCRDAGVAVVSRGAGTGLSGGAMPCAHGIVLGLSKMNAILDLDPTNRLARVQPGVRNLAVSEAAAPHGLYYAPDPSSQIACTIGGNVAENAGGVHCLKYGLTVHNLTALTLVTIDGELLHLGSAAADAPGYDLTALLTGSEGMLGVVVEATLRLLPRPAVARVLLAAFARIEDAADSVAAIIRAGIIPAGVEIMDNPAIRAAEDFAHAGYPRDAAAIMLCELDGGEAETAAGVDEVSHLARQHHATDIRVSRNAAERAKMWSGRKNAFPAVGRLSPDYYCIDGTIPRKSLAPVLTAINTAADAAGLTVVNVFHAGDGNLHPLILYDAARPGELEATERLGEEIMQLCLTAGGTITGEHGVGIEKLGAMCHQFTPQELALFHTIRECFDPNHLLNPGKAIPTLARCAEHNAMHVHHGEVPFPEIERF